MRKHGGTPSRRDKHVTLAAISPPGVARGRFVGGQQSGLAGCKLPPLFTRGASSCSAQGRRQGEPWGASPQPSAPTYLPTVYLASVGQRAILGLPLFARYGLVVLPDPGCFALVEDLFQGGPWDEFDYKCPPPEARTSLNMAGSR